MYEVADFKASEAEITATKTLENADIKNYQFSFKLTEMTKNGEGNYSEKLHGHTQTVQNDEKGIIHFSAITYAEEGTYYYQIEELSTNKQTGITYDTNKYLVTVEVSKNVVTGLFEVQIKYPEELDGITFTNTYTSTTSASASLKIAKAVTGTGAPSTVPSIFRFTVEAIEANVGSAPMPAESTVTNTAGEVTFGSMTFTEAGTYKYKITETGYVEGADTIGWTPLSADVVYAQVVVSKNGNALSAVTTYYTDEACTETSKTTNPTITNTFTKPTSTTASLEIAKAVTGEGVPTTVPNIFQFTVERVGSTTSPLPTPSTVTNTAGKVTFGNMTFTESGTYKYKITETGYVAGADTPGWTSLSTDVVYAKVEVTRKTNLNELESNVSYYSDSACNDPLPAPTITNTYTKPGSTSASLSIKKATTGTGAPTGNDIPGIFTFTVTAVTAGAPMPTPATKTNNGENVDFAPILYDADDYDANSTHTYIYKISENAIPAADVEWTAPENADIYAKVVLTKDETTSALSSGVTYYSDAACLIPVENPTITNTYTEVKEASGKLELNVTKSMKNSASKKDLSKFAFTLNQTSPASTLKIDKNADATGNVKFEFSYGEDDKGTTFIYEITEQPGSDATVIYDPAVYTVTAKVADKADAEGVLAVEVSVKKKVGETTTDLGANGAVEFVNDETTVAIDKTDKDTGASLTGATLQIVDSETGDVVEGPWTTDGKAHDVTGKLEFGKTYTLKETVAPDGYEVTSDTEFTLKADGTIDSEQTTTTVKDGVLLVEDSLTSIKISKVDVTNSEELAGAHIQILDSKGKVVEEWTSTTTPHEVKGLKTGETYTLRETVAPNGYTVTTDTTFTLDAKGEVDSTKTTTHAKGGVLLVEDSLNELSIQKVDETGAAVSGAKLVIKDAADKIVESWTTDGAAHVLSGYGKGKYTLSEVEAPEGYQVSEDVPFEITGKEKAGEVISLTMTDTKKPVDANRSLRVTKHLKLDGISSDVGVHEADYYVALYSDAEREHRVSDVKKITFRNSTTSSVLFNNLGLGTYYVGETDENGTKLISKRVNDRLIFYPEYGAEASFTFEGSTTDGVAEFTNVYMELPAGFYLSGRLTVTKKLLVGGVAAASSNTYYARVFSDKALTKPACDVLALSLGGNSSASITVTDLPIGETLDSSAAYYVAETDVNGTPLDPAAVTEYKISIDKSEVVLNNSNWNQEVVITNDYAAAEEYESEFESEYESEFESETEVEETKTAPKTGDDTDYMRYLLLMALSAGACAAAYGQKRRKKRARR